MLPQRVNHFSLVLLGSSDLLLLLVGAIVCWPIARRVQSHGQPPELHPRLELEKGSCPIGDLSSSGERENDADTRASLGSDNNGARADNFHKIVGKQN